MTTARLLCTIALVSPLTLAACGSSSDTSPAASASSATPDGGSTSDAAAGDPGSSDPDASATSDGGASSACVVVDRGYAVVAPDASGGSVWETNVPPYAQSWSGSSDDVFMHGLFAAMASGGLGHVDAARLYAMGISSGGFMTSRMAVSYAGRFRALADHSGSYATCSTLCNVPTPLAGDHPPILFLRGEKDTLVPGSSVTPYLDALVAEGHEAKLITDPAAGHEWLAAGPTAIPAWFDAHP